MSTGYQIKDQSAAYFITLQVVEWVDVFTREQYKDIVIDNLKYCQQDKGLAVFSYVIMSNHIHMIVQSKTDNLSSTLRDFKSFTSKTLFSAIATNKESRRNWMLDVFSKSAIGHKRNSKFQIWTHENHAVHICSDTFVRQRLEYIHMNPVRAGIVTKPEDYLYSSARNYAELDFVMPVELLRTNWITYS